MLWPLRRIVPHEMVGHHGRATGTDAHIEREVRRRQGGQDDVEADVCGACPSRPGVCVADRPYSGRRCEAADAALRPSDAHSDASAASPTARGEVPRGSPRYGRLPPLAHARVGGAFVTAAAAAAVADSLAFRATLLVRPRLEQSTRERDGGTVRGDARLASTVCSSVGAPLSRARPRPRPSPATLRREKVDNQ